MQRNTPYIILIFILILPVSNFAQQKEDYPEKTIDFWESIEKLEERYDLTTIVLKTGFTPEEVKDIAKRYIDAKYEDPVSFKKYKIKKHDELRDKAERGNKEKHILVGYIMSEIMEHTRKDSTYPVNFVAIMKADFFLKVKIIKKYRSTYDTYFNNDAYTGIVEDMLQGSLDFQRGDTIDFSTSPFGENIPGIFKEDMTYLIPFIWEGQGRSYDYIAVSLPDSCHALYPIIDEKLMAPGNAFQLGDNIQWKDFKNAFNETYVNMNFEEKTTK